ncbi:nuclear transport factor 2 family protein [Vibrio alginolyticus]|uniref:nuclear transport factor 2 family protein n=1 Tax=Vibrio alginolyticus TaxID=663 RepID=UPI0006CA6CFE|nr:nuclear transport factor 2 family protein [Vibrio alginolyticus]EHC9865202.1 nuclear transport factor 2 family protein [Vibrio alginolyticus]EJS0322606.1 nuclear transport factor 2 family protein [Vibrio alginolyticus]ELA7831818.1 nuclear transport factor 2 family protein [Vibrio alginolyticus]ELB2905798.1 nuclear transport factor 2 family protein [Vibrio alginolyticus]ELW1398729.1 nuclear transport factor 2 family protein [Vibrio alginolyticus]
MEKDDLVGLVVKYFEKIDAGDPSYLDLFSEDVDFFFPKFGQAKGKSALVEFGNRIGSSLINIWHDIDGFQITTAGNKVIVEGQESGVMSDGTSWPDNKVSTGRFCSVFEFEGKMISRMFVYVDPDFPSRDFERISVLAGENNVRQTVQA